MRPVEVAQQAERLDYHSLWFGDHVTMPKTTVEAHPTNPDATARRAYPINVNSGLRLVFVFAKEVAAAKRGFAERP